MRRAGTVIMPSNSLHDELVSADLLSLFIRRLTERVKLNQFLIGTI